MLKKTMRTYYISLLLIIALHVNTNAQYIDMRFIDILNHKQLTSSFTTCIAEDSLGFIWIGTQDGLNRFDGINVKKYAHNPNLKGSLPHNNINTLHVHSNNKLYIGSGLGLFVYNNELDNFTTIADEFNLAGLNAVQINKIRTGPDNKLYVLTNSIIHIANDSITFFSPFIEIIDANISSFIFDADNSVWIGTLANGLYHFSDKCELIRHYTLNNDGTGLSHNGIMDVDIRNNEIWIATNGGGINIFNKTTMRFSYPEGAGPYTEYATDVFIDNENHVWTIDVTGLKLYGDKEKMFYGYYPYKLNPYSIKSSVVDIFQDKNDYYWTLHYPGGVGLRILPRGFWGINKDANEQIKLLDDNVSTICEDKEGNIWVGYPTNGISIFNLNKGTVKQYTYEPNNAYSIGEGSINKIFRDSKNIMWVGSFKGGLQYFDAKTERFISYKHSDEDEHSIANNDIRDITEDKEGNLWITTHGKGLDKFNREKEIFTHFNSANNGLSNDWTFSVICDSNQNIWVGSVWGLNKLKKGSKTFKTYYQYDETQSIYHNDIVCLHNDVNGNIWIGTPYGLNKYKAELDDFERIQPPNGSNLSVAAILSTKDSALWISTIHGLYRYAQPDSSWSTFDKFDGLQSEEFALRANYSNDTRLYFGGTNGLDIIEPDNLNFNDKLPQVVFTDFQLFYESITPQTHPEILSKSITYCENINLNYDHKVIGFEFVALNMAQSYKNQYQYKMEGFDEKWIQSGTRNNVTYTNLNPGEYTFKVKASNNDNIWNEKGAQIHITIHPPWWQTLGFKIISAIFVLSLTIVIFKLRIKQLKQNQIKLEKLVNEKTIELREKNQSLFQNAEELRTINDILVKKQERIEEQNEEITAQTDKLEKVVLDLEKSNSAKNKMLSIISHDLRSPFSSIMGLSDVLTDSYDILNSERRIKIIKAINQSSHTVFNLLENLLFWARSQSKVIKFSPQPTNLNALIKELYPIVLPPAKSKKITLENICANNVTIDCDQQMIETVIRNLISNAIKFTPENGTITLTLDNMDNEISFCVKDTGLGMTNDIIKNIFNVSKSKVRRGTSGESGSGLGLLLCKEFVEMHNGNLTVKSKPGEGTQICFSLPKKQTN